MNFRIKTYRLLFVLFSLVLILSCKNRGNNIVQKISEDLNVSESLSDVDLNGNKLTVKVQGLVLENISNGHIEISPEVGAGTVFIRNCKSVNLSILSKASIILEGNNSVNFLEIKDNARIVSRKQIEEKYKNKKKKLFGKKEEGDAQAALIYEAEVESGLKPVLEGGVYLSILTKEAASIVLKQEAMAEVHEIVEEKKPLVIKKDSSYAGYGVRLNILNRPEDAAFLVVSVSDGLNQWTEEITDLTDSWTNENLKINTKYEVIFQYFKKMEENESSGMNVLCGAASIDVISVKEKFTGLNQNGIFISEDYIMKIEDESLFSDPPENVTGFSIEIRSSSKKSFCRVPDITKLREIDLKPYIYSNWELCEEAVQKESFYLELAWLSNNTEAHEYFFWTSKIAFVDNIPFLWTEGYEPLRWTYEEGVVTVVQAGEKLVKALKEIYPRYTLLVDTPAATMFQRQILFDDIYKPIDVSDYFEDRSFEIDKNNGNVTVKLYIANKKQQWYMNIHPDTVIKVRE